MQVILGVTPDGKAPSQPHYFFPGYVVTPYVGGVAQLSVLIPGTGTTTVMKGLTNGVAYTFTVAAENGRASSGNSAMSGTITAGAPAMVTSLHVTRAAKGALRVAFGTPAGNGSPITTLHGDVQFEQRWQGQRQGREDGTAHCDRPQSGQDLQVHGQRRQQARHRAYVAHFGSRQSLNAQSSRPAATPRYRRQAVTRSVRIATLSNHE